MPAKTPVAVFIPRRVVGVVASVAQARFAAVIGGIVATRAAFARRAEAVEAVRVLDAGAAVHARVQRAVTDLVAAVRSRKSVGASAVERVDTVYARAPIGAGLVQAVIGTRLTVLPFESFLADARERLTRVEARGAVVARMLIAREMITCCVKQSINQLISQLTSINLLNVMVKYAPVQFRCKKNPPK